MPTARFFLASLAALTLGSAAAHAQRNVRMATYNVQMIDAAVKRAQEDLGATDEYYEDGDLISDLDRATLIANAVLASDYEIVAFNEVFDEDVRDRISAILDPVFGFHIDYISRDLDLEDSGLMIFSRHPFLPMKLMPHHEKDEGDVELVLGNSVTIEQPNGFVGFTSFGCDPAYASEPVWAQADCYADKGAGIVRVGLPMGEEIFVIFSHFVATYSGDSETVKCAKRDDRAIAFRQVEKLLEDAATEVGPSPGFYNPPDHYAVMLGDLNIQGNPHYSNASECQNEEWTWFFDPLDAMVRFAACGDRDIQDCLLQGRTMLDAWTWDTSVADLGRTSSFDFQTDLTDSDLDRHGKRLDYVLYRGSSPSASGQVPILQMTPQHLHLPWDLSGEAGQRSDHLPVAVDMMLAPADITLDYSTAREALNFTVAPVGTQIANLSFNVPGAMQWLILDGEPGTYRLNTNASFGVDFEVYRPQDLSRPLAMRRDDGRRGEVYLLDNPPYYIRTFAGSNKVHDRVTSGPYTFTAKRHDCQSVPEACILRAGAAGQSVIWPNQLINNEDSLYFEVLGDDADEPTVPNHIFTVTQDMAMIPTPPFDFEVLTFPAAQQIPNITSQVTAAEWARYQVTMQGLRGVPAVPSHQSHLLRVGRTDPNWAGQTTVSHASDLTYFVPISLRIREHGDDSEHDELRVHLSVGAAMAETVTQANVHQHAAAFTPLPMIDDGKFWPAESLGQFKYTTELSVLILEDDDEDGNDEPGDFELAEPHYDNDRADFFHGNSVHPILPQNSSENHVWNWTERHQLPSDPDDADYWYQLKFRLSQVPPCLQWTDVPGCP